MTDPVILSWWAPLALGMISVLLPLLPAVISYRLEIRRLRCDLSKKSKEVADLRGLCTGLSAQQDEAEARAKDAESRFSQQFKRIEGYLCERDRWNELYNEQASQNGTAQSMLFAERQTLIRQLQALGQKPRIDNRIERVVSAFSGAHLASAPAADTPPQVGNVLGDK